MKRMLLLAVASVLVSTAFAQTRATGTVRAVDLKQGTVRLSHDPIQSLNWPAMTMTFKVKDKAMLDKLGEGKKVDVEFEQRGKDYVVTKMK
ncbi:MAG TPA: copper-binding protein [Burkholderiales bacterium]|nr:copper-binding protein [Burkholderiales bacterium]